ncbi:hypothetical protein [uncultured Lacticaseibacillus sp.]|uniref:hypothetical protein n=1 Tax=uncultured Lacticaseibacillus sp. TaxID=2775882 RepID=UPI00258A9898|nr:hypothetical protein [uncultured Lacticaseibacillus sp.]
MNKGKSKERMGCMQIAICLTAIGIMDAGVTMYGWNTYMVPMFKLPYMHLGMALGLLTFFNYLILKRSDLRDDKPFSTDDVVRAVFTAFTTLFMLWVFHFIA